jgi:hypothetical protein
VEEVKDPLGRKLERATPSEAGKPVREDWKPLPFRHGEMSPGSREYLVYISIHQFDTLD